MQKKMRVRTRNTTLKKVYRLLELNTTVYQRAVLTVYFRTYVTWDRSVPWGALWRQYGYFFLMDRLRHKFHASYAFFSDHITNGKDRPRFCHAKKMMSFGMANGNGLVNMAWGPLNMFSTNDNNTVCRPEKCKKFLAIHSFVSKIATSLDR